MGEGVRLMQMPASGESGRNERKTLTVFISSPGDVRAERRLAEDTIKRLNSLPQIARRYNFKTLAYEHDVPPEGGKVPQDIVDNYLGKAGEADVYIMILSQRFGTPLQYSGGELRIDPITGRPYLSGTEYEFLHAYRENHRTQVVRPVILLYRGIKSVAADTDSEQLQRVKDFFNRFQGPKPEFKGIIKDYETPDRFAEYLFNDLVQIFGRKWIDIEEVPDIADFIGREQESATLAEWISGRDCRVVEVVAGGGSGKSALAAKVKDLLKDEFQYIFWRTLKNAPPLVMSPHAEGVLEECLRFLSNHLIERLPATVDERIESLLTYLRQRRCLLVLDNLETIMRFDKHDDRFKDGYETYGTLIERVATEDHQSCLLITTRRQPHVISQLEARSDRVRSLPLWGLRADEPLALLRAVLSHDASVAQGSEGQPSDWDHLVALADGWQRNYLDFPAIGAQVGRGK